LENTVNEIFNSFGSFIGGDRSRIVIITHENPDGDAIGSAVGLAEVLSNAGHDVKIIVPNDYPAFLQWFSTKIDILIYEKKKRQAVRIINESDLLICLDFNEPKRAGRLEKHITSISKPLVVIDHHPNPADFADLLISETSYSSTAELVYDVLKNTGFDNYINKEAAEALFTGIMTDTGSFGHGLSGSNPFLVASELMKWGIDAEKIQSRVYHNFSVNRMKLMGYCVYKKMEVFPELRSAVICLSRGELEDFQFEPGDTEGFVNIPLSINNIVFSALFIEKKDIVKASFRSKGDFPVNKFASEHFNGGGHINAAGGESDLTINETLNKFKQLLTAYSSLLLETKI